MVFGKHDLADLPLLLLLSVSASALFLAAMIMLQSLAFLIAGINTSADLACNIAFPRLSIGVAERENR